MAVTTAARQQVQEEQVMRIAGYILEAHYGYTSDSSVRVLERCENEIPKNLTEKDRHARELERTRCRRALKAARLIRPYMMERTD